MRDHLDDLADRLRATPTELVGVLVLLSGVVAVTLVLGMPPATRGSTAEPTAPVAAVPIGEVTVHVSGAVVRPAVRTLPDGSRVADALEASGGARADADLDGLNLARILTDGEQVRVPRRTDGAGPGHAPDTAPVVRDAEGRLDLNAATPSDLEELPGIGPVLAQRIVDWRDRDGPFRDVGQLREVPGIGERTFQTLAPGVVVR